MKEHLIWTHDNPMNWRINFRVFSISLIDWLSTNQSIYYYVLSPAIRADTPNASHLLTPSRPIHANFLN